MILSDPEITAIFMAIDTDKSMGITYEELVLSFRDVHTNYILFKVK